MNYLINKKPHYFAGLDVISTAPSS